MSHCEECGHDDGESLMKPPPYSYTLKALDFLGIGLTGLALAIEGVGNGLHYIVQVSAKECYMAAAGQRERAHERSELKRLESYSKSFEVRELGP